ncbi:MAG TPA: hybrid sensor histidine kinase/response regulator [Kofleriaceae bacterium]|jgi:signal transduction histidine kinase|nr:hybrid sensor histidine kinase/response regulator [Kofleriaceae bacterium]
MLRILVVGGEPGQRNALRAVIDGEVVEAPGAAEARVEIGSGPYDCMFVDEDVPPIGGAALVAALRTAGVTTPIVFVGGSDEERLQQAVDAGITDFVLRSDLSPRRLGLRIRYAIRSVEVEQAKRQSLTAAAHARDEVLAVVSHDLRGPLHAISLASEAMRDEAPDTCKRYLDAVDRAIGRAERLISDLLDASAVENGALALARAAVNINAIVRQAAADHELAARESGGSVRATVPKDPIIVSADRERVLQVLSNLIGNSLKHAKGTSIDLAVEQSGGEAVISVRDGGPGIPLPELPHVFDRYWSGSRAARRGGAGLGLAIAKGIVSAHGGDIAVESQAGQGASFRFTLPLATPTT